jgi:oxygen-independent coproporphyrinogen-3 oxidase
VQSILEHLGFKQYEISNFALEGKECRHNQNYWDCGEYYGFGLSSHSYLDEIRAENVSSLDDYLRFPIQNHVAFKDELGKNEKITEKIMLSLRTTNGLNLKELKDMGHDIFKEKESIIKALEKNNMIKVENGFLKIEKDKFVVSNQIILELI